MARTTLKGTLPTINFSAKEAWLTAEIVEDGGVTISRPSTDADSINLTAAEAVKLGDALSTLGLRALALKRGDV